MNIGLLCCWSKMRIYPVYSSHLQRSLEALTGSTVPVVTTNCMCFNKDDAVDDHYEFIKLPYYDFQHPKSIDRSKVVPRLKHYVKTETYSMVEYLRGRAFATRADQFDVVDFQQSSYAFGYEALVSFLSSSSKAKKVITVHKLDDIQKEKPSTNLIYNKADAVIVFSRYMKELLVRDGVRADRVHVIYHGTSLPPLSDTPRDQAILFCGSPIRQIKGFEHFVVALRQLREEGIDLKTKVYGFFRHGEREYAIGLAAQENVDGLLHWQSFQSEEELIGEYQKSFVSIIPYTGYAGYFPAAYSMGNAVPIIATDILGHAEYVRDAGIMIPPASTSDLVAAIKRVHGDEDLRRTLGADGRKRAEETLSWDTVAEETLEVFRGVLAGGTARTQAGAAV